LDKLGLSELVKRAQEARKVKEKSEKPRRYTDEFLKKIAEDYDKGLTWEELCKKYGVSKTTIRRAVIKFSKYGFYSTARKDKVTDELLKAIAKDYDKGLTWKEIREKYGVSHKTISRAITKYSQYGHGGKRAWVVTVRAHGRNHLLTLPLHLANKFGIKAGTKVKWKEEDGKLVLEVVE
jgi:Mor family transcriptional regulator